MERCINEWIINNDRQPFLAKINATLVPLCSSLFRNWNSPFNHRNRFHDLLKSNTDLFSIVKFERSKKEEIVKNRFKREWRNEIAMLGWMNDNNFSLVYSGLIRGISKSVEERVSTRSIIYKTLGTRAFIPHSCFIAHETTDDPLIKQAR